MKRLRLIFIILTIVALIGVTAPLTVSDKIDDDKTEDLFIRGLGSVDSILNKNDYGSERFASFKESCSNMSLEELEQESYRCISKNDSIIRVEMFCRAVIDRYDKGMGRTDKTKILKILNNLGFIYFERHNPLEAYTILKTALEMERIFDLNDVIESALLINMAGIFKSLNDLKTAEKLYSDAFDTVFDKQFNPGSTRLCESIRVHAIIEYLNYLWMTDTGKSITEPCETFFRMVPDSFYELYPCAKFMCEATMSYSAHDYVKSAALLDSAFCSLNKNWQETSYRAYCKLMKADALLKANISTETKEALHSANRIIKSKNIIYLMPELKKRTDSYYNVFGDSIFPSHNPEMAIFDSIYNSRTYAAVRDVRESWNRAIYDIEGSNDNRYTMIAIISAVLLGLSAAGIVITSLIIRRRIIIHKDIVSEDRVNDCELTSSDNPIQKGQEEEQPDEDLSAFDTDVGIEETDPITPCDETESDIPDENLHALYEDIRNALASSRNIYNIDFSIESLAEETGISSRRISQVVNACSGKNFSRLLAEYRVKEACRILKDAKNPVMRPTMDSLAEKVGYKSRTHLTRVFKTEIGLTPAEYIATLSSES